MSLCVPKSSKIHETLCFLLDHPRRCFIYLFPSHQTWFLLTVLVFLKYVWSLLVIFFCNLTNRPPQFYGLVLLHGVGYWERGHRGYTTGYKVLCRAFASDCGPCCRIQHGLPVSLGAGGEVRTALPVFEHWLTIMILECCTLS